MGYKFVDKDFDFQGKEYWYTASVYYKYSYRPATWDSPAEEDFTGEVDLVEVSEYVEGKEVELDTDKIPKDLADAIEEDALEDAQINAEE